MTAEKAHVGMQVRVSKEHRIANRRGMIGQVVGCYGGEGYMAVDVRFADGRNRLFWPRDLQEVSTIRPSWWRSLLGR